MLSTILALLFSRSGLTISDSRQEIVIGTDGTLASVNSRSTGESLITKPSPFSSVKVGGRIYEATSAEGDVANLVVTYGDSGVKAFYHVQSGGHGIAFTIDRVDGNPDELTILKVPYKAVGAAGSLMAIRVGTQTSDMVMNGNENVKPEIKPDGSLACTTYPATGLVGSAVMISAPAAEFTNDLHQAELENGVPSATIGGVPAKVSAAANDGYLFTDPNLNEIDEAIDYAKHGGLGSILVMEKAWVKSSGTYDVNRKYFPGGMSDLRAASDKVHAAGLKFGLHFLAPVVGFSDPLYNKGIQGGLYRDGEGSLQDPIGTTEGQIVVSGFRPTGTGALPLAAGDRLALGSELVVVRSVNGAIAQVQRGANGTPKLSHSPGEDVHRIVNRYGGGIVDLKSTYKNIVAQNLARALAGANADMAYFDGSEGTTVEGPLWSTAGVLPVEVYKHLNKDLLVMGSAVTPWQWHIMARGTTDDFAAINPGAFLDTRKVSALTYYTINGLPAEFGWWAILGATNDHPATTVLDIDHLGSRMVAYNVPVGIESTLAQLRSNKRSIELLDRLAEYEKIRKAGVSADVRSSLKKGEWSLQSGQFVGGNVAVSLNGHQEDTTQLAMRPNGSRIIGFKLEPSMDTVDQNGILNGLTGNLNLQNPNPTYPGVVAAMQRFVKPLDLSQTTGLRIGLNVRGLSNGDSPILNVQLMASDGMLRDFAVKVTQNGSFSTTVGTPTTFDGLSADRPAPDARAYGLKRSVYNFNYKSVIAVYFRWMRAPQQGTSVQVVGLDAGSVGQSGLSSPVIQFGDFQWRVPVTLGPGESLEWDGRSTQATYFHADGSVGGRFDVPDAIRNLPSSNTTVSVLGGGAYKLTVL